MIPKSSSPSLEEPPSLARLSDPSTQIYRCQEILAGLRQNHLPLSFRVSPEPFSLSPATFRLIEQLGPALLKFYQVQNRCYYESIKGNLPRWVSQYLDLGKPDQIVEFGRMNRIKSALPGIIRPDLILTSEGMFISELDSVPGGFGLTHLLNLLYERIGFSPLGGDGGMTGGFIKMIRSLHPEFKEIRLGLIVSEESEDYRPEMDYFVKALDRPEFSVYLCRPEEIFYTEEGAFLKNGETFLPLTVIYRFLELFDSRNIPKMDLLFYSSKKEKVVVTPPFKAFLEEKLWFALFHHPALRPFWEKELGEETYYLLKPLIPQTWILDPRELPPYGVIPDLYFRKKPVTRWEELYEAGQKERRYVIKPSGFSELAWGARGVKIGHDLSSQEWRCALEEALRAYPKNLYLLQEFHSGRRFETNYFDRSTETVSQMSGRTRLSPYYFTSKEGVDLGGILATICPSDKKIIHGMSDAVMAPCQIVQRNSEG